MKYENWTMRLLVKGSLCVVALLSLSACSAGGGGADADVDSTAQALQRVNLNGLDYYLCSSEGQNCVIGGDKYAAFGANNLYTFKAVSGTFSCSVNFFGVDPAPGLVKSCSFANDAFSVNEGSTSTAKGFVAFGATGVFRFAHVNGNYTCNSATFGGDPKPGTVKACYNALEGYAEEATENGSFPVLNNQPVAYGANGHFTLLRAIGNGTLGCNTAVFGGVDPAPGFVKSCYNAGGFFLTLEGTSGIGNPQFASLSYTSAVNGNILVGVADGPFSCSNAFFGGDPDVGDGKICYQTGSFGG